MDRINYICHIIAADNIEYWKAHLEEMRINNKHIPEIGVNSKISVCSWNRALMAQYRCEDYTNLKDANPSVFLFYYTGVLYNLWPAGRMRHTKTTFATKYKLLILFGPRHGFQI